MLSRVVVTILAASFLIEAQPRVEPEVPRIVPELQAIEERAIAQMLASNDSAEQAWGAYFVGKLGHSKFVSDVRRLMASWHPDVQMQSLDALIQLDADVPSEELMPLWPRYPEPVLILLAKKPQENKDVLHSRISQQVTNEEWVALHNLLISIQASGLALELLQALDMKITVQVVDTNPIGVGGGAGGGIVGCGGAGYRNGFPPLVVYRLSGQPTKGDVLLTPGLHPIYYRRQADPTQHSSSIDRNLYRYHFLAELMRTSPANLAMEPYVSKTIVWQGSDEYIAAMTNFRGSAQEQFQRLLWQLQEAHVLTSSEAGGLKLRLKIDAVDLRGNQKPSLPVLDVQ